MFQIAENLRFLRYDAQSRTSQSDANAAAIRRLEVRIDALERTAWSHETDPSDAVPR